MHHPPKITLLRPSTSSDKLLSTRVVFDSEVAQTRGEALESGTGRSGLRKGLLFVRIFHVVTNNKRSGAEASLWLAKLSLDMERTKM